MPVWTRSTSYPIFMAQLQALLLAAPGGTPPVMDLFEVAGLRPIASAITAVTL